jgi:hypothetical protein
MGSCSQPGLLRELQWRPRLHHCWHVQPVAGVGRVRRGGPRFRGRVVGGGLAARAPGSSRARRRDPSSAPGGCSVAHRLSCAGFRYRRARRANRCGSCHIGDCHPTPHRGSTSTPTSSVIGTDPGQPLPSPGCSRYEAVAFWSDPGRYAAWRRGGPVVMVVPSGRWIVSCRVAVRLSCHP